MKRNGRLIKKIDFNRKKWAKNYVVRADRRNGKLAAKKD